jgi:hypothetical protein
MEPPLDSQRVMPNSMKLESTSKRNGNPTSANFAIEQECFIATTLELRQKMYSHSMDDAEGIDAHNMKIFGTDYIHRIPRELRDEIYRLYIEDVEPKGIVDPRKIKLLGVSKQTEAETKDIMFKKYVIEVKLKGCLLSDYNAQWLIEGRYLRIKAKVPSQVEEQAVPLLLKRTDLKTLQVVVKEAIPKGMCFKALEARRVKKFERLALPFRKIKVENWAKAEWGAGDIMKLVVGEISKSPKWYKVQLKTLGAGALIEDKVNIPIGSE